jgi:hypothetical protein
LLSALLFVSHTKLVVPSKVSNDVNTQKQNTELLKDDFDNGVCVKQNLSVLEIRKDPEQVRLNNLLHEIHKKKAEKD